MLAMGLALVLDPDLLLLDDPTVRQEVLGG